MYFFLYLSARIPLMASEGELSISDPSKFRLLEGKMKLKGGSARFQLLNGRLAFQAGQDEINILDYSGYDACVVKIVDSSLVTVRRGFLMGSANENRVILSALAPTQIFEGLVRPGEEVEIERFESYKLFLRNLSVSERIIDSSPARRQFIKGNSKEE